MWKNAVMPPFLRWLRGYNTNLMPQQKVGIYGMDLYSLHRSAAAVVNYLEKVDPETAKRAKQRYNCFEKFGEDTQTYAWASLFGLSKARSPRATYRIYLITGNVAQRLRHGFLAVVTLPHCSIIE
jgi:erythromycin esterase-like protein